MSDFLDNYAERIKTISDLLEIAAEKQANLSEEAFEKWEDDAGWDEYEFKLRNFDSILGIAENLLGIVRSQEAAHQPHCVDENEQCLPGD